MNKSAPGLFIWLSVLLSSFIISSAAHAVCGDVSGDGLIMSNDVLMAARASIGALALTPDQISRADVALQCGGTNPDAQIMSNDLLMIARASLGVIELSCAETEAITWLKKIGGTGNEEARSVIQTSDGGYVMAGYTDSYGAGGKDAYVIKLDGSGSQLWAKTYGGAYADEAHSIIQTSDGGFVFIGTTITSADGFDELLAVKLDASGNQIWTKAFPGSGASSGGDVLQTQDGGYLIVPGNENLIKLDSSGNLLWNKAILDYGRNYESSLKQTSDNGYVVAGWTDACGADCAPDFWIVKLDASWNPLCTKTYGRNTGPDKAYTINSTSDAGYIVAGFTNDPIAQNTSVPSGWILKLDASGNKVWDKILGVQGTAELRSAFQTTGGNYIAAGTNTAGEETNNSTDFYLAKLDSTGNVIWEKKVGLKSSWDSLYSAQQTSDGGFILAGLAADVYGTSDILVIKVDSAGNYKNCP